MKNKKVLARLLKDAADRFSNDGCSDFEVRNNAKNRQLILDIAKWDSGTSSDEYTHAQEEFEQ